VSVILFSSWQKKSGRLCIARKIMMLRIYFAIIPTVLFLETFQIREKLEKNALLCETDLYVAWNFPRSKI